MLIIDEVQHAMGSEDGDNMLLALKAARDEINLTPDTPGYFLFVGTGSHRARVRELRIKGKQGGQGVKKIFSAATLKEYGVELGRPVGAEEIQKVATMLVDSNILARDGHGIYGISDPFVAEAYSSRADVLKTLEGPEALR
ncbi:hypothetical protein [Aquabacterium sp.]|uniref:hypothetical protein n=1 Tax=Aquabacterium sp. TaxID=1872578 RepID=UPI0019BF2499|nr:hypothetical protein [Aquabacterium sp.]MBC7699847.1 hypothetical protein [Aquabacterium sp.]